MNSSHNQFDLLKTKRFLPFFLTQFLGAFNDSAFKQFIVFLVLASTVKIVGLSSGLLLTIIPVVFILPFFLFSGFSAQLAERYDKSKLIQRIKFAEIIIMILGGIGFYFENGFFLLIVLFLMGTQSTLFGPLKYSLLPEALEPNELVGGNAFIEFGTFFAILCGTMLGILIEYSYGKYLAIFLVVAFAVCGWICSLSIPKTEASNPDQTRKIDFNIIRSTKRIIKITKEDTLIYYAVIGISWFWFIGSLLLSQVPTLITDVLKADTWLINIFMSVFTIGIGIGSFLCNRVLKSQVHTTYLPLSSLIMTVALLFLAWLTQNNYFMNPELTTISQFFSDIYGWGFVLALFLISASGGFFVVPLYAYIQINSPKEICSHVIAGTNIYSSLYMVASGVFVIILKVFGGFSMAQIFFTTACLNGFVTYLIIQLLPEDVLRSILRYVFKLFFKAKVEGLENLVKSGDRSIIIANHFSLLDAPLIVSLINEKVTFAIDTNQAKRWWLKPFLRIIDTLPLDPHNPMAVKSLIKCVREGKRVMIFPEGRVTTTGSLMKIYEGPGLIAAKTNANIIPLCIEGAQYSYFSYLRGKVKMRLFPKIKLTFLEPRKIKIPSELMGRKKRQYASEKIYRIMTNTLLGSYDKTENLFELLEGAAKIHGRRKVIVQDANQNSLTYSSLIKKSYVFNEIIRKKVHNEKNIGVMLPNVAATSVLFFALQLSAKTAVMLNFSSGFKNLMYACDTVKLKYVYTSRAFIEAVGLEEVIEGMENKGIEIIYLEDLKQVVRLKDKVLGVTKSILSPLYTSKNRAKPEDPSVILFTSGSENIPKAVVLSHFNLISNMQQSSIVVDFNSRDVVLNALPLFHSFGLSMGMILPVISGLKVFLYPSPLHYRIIPQISYDINATILFGTDTFLKGYARVAHPYDFYSLRYVFSGAEKLQDKTRDLWINNFGIRIFEGYGATEAAPVISINTPLYNRVGSVGKILPGINYHIEKVEGIEEGGRLHISGPNLMSGYIKHDEPGKLGFPTLENETMTPLKKLKWYDTGDVVRIDEDGYIFIVGRSKRFAKIAGEMVSLVAIENYCNTLFPEDSHASAVLQDSAKGEKIVLVTTADKMQKSDLIAYIKQQQMSSLYLPSEIIVVDEMPLLGSGKTDYSGVKKICEDKNKKE